MPVPVSGYRRSGGFYSYDYEVTLYIFIYLVRGSQYHQSTIQATSYQNLYLNELTITETDALPGIFSCGTPGDYRHSYATTGKRYMYVTLFC